MIFFKIFKNLNDRKLVGTLTIKFYNENEASIEYETKISDEEQKNFDLIQLFALYYAKMLYNLNRGEHADKLIVCIQTVIEGIMTESITDGSIASRINILVRGLKLVEPKASRYIKKYSAKLFEKSNQTRFITTHMSIGGELYYAPVSTIMFLQYLIDNLPEELLAFLALVLAGMHKYYKEVNDYYKILSIIEAPNYGFIFASQVLFNELNRGKRKYAK